MNINKQLRHHKILSQIIHEYVSGTNTVILAKKYNTTRKTIVNILKENDVTLRTPSQYLRKYKLDETSFDELNPQSLYWIGFLLADGNLFHRNNEYIIQIGLQESDYKHLEKFCQFLKTNKPLQYDKGNKSVHISINSKHIFDQLSKYGLRERKSLDADVIPIIAESWDFWRGYIDGDGSFNTTTNYRVSLISSNHLSDKFCKLINTNFHYDCTIYQHSLSPKMRMTQITKLNIIHKLLRNLYTTDFICLDRKLIQAEILINAKLKYKTHVG